nr:hypothetical protein [Hymenobacter lapidarius]
MLLPSFLRLAAAFALLCATSCSHDLAERPNAGLVADAVDNQAPAAATSLLNVRWELRELAGQPAPTMEAPPPISCHATASPAPKAGPAATGFRARTALRPWASCASARCPPPALPAPTSPPKRNSCAPSTEHSSTVSAAPP